MYHKQKNPRTSDAVHVVMAYGACNMENQNACEKCRPPNSSSHSKTSQKHSLNNYLSHPCSKQEPEPE